MKNIESKIQIACVNWFRYQYPHLKKLLFSVPNGGARSSITGAILKAEGALSGVADLILLKPNGRYASLCIEMKQPRGVQRESQREWQKAVEAAGNRYVVCRSLEEFMKEVNVYLNNEYE